MTSQKLLDEAWKQAQEITNWFHVKASPDNDPRAIEHLAIRMAEFAASCLADSVAIQAAEKAILIQEIEQHTATKALLKAREQEIERMKAEIASAKKDAEFWEHRWRIYRDAWARELGGWLIPKSHDIDSLVLTTRKSCVIPLRGNCSTPHWLGQPTADRRALQQTLHPRENGCRDWVCDTSEPNPRAESAERELAELKGKK